MRPLLRAATAALTAAVVLAGFQLPAWAERDLETDFDPMHVDLERAAPSVGDDEVVASATDAPDRSAAEDMTLRSLVDAIVELPTVALNEELRCLATAVYFESRGEPVEGQLAVAQVIKNRVAASKWPKDICAVVYQPGQFSFAFDQHPDKPKEGRLWREAQAVALIAATDSWEELVPSATHFHATRVSPGWRNLQRVSTIGNHVFYR